MTEPTPPVRIGSRWIWEIEKTHAREVIEVCDARWNGEEWWIQTVCLPTGLGLFDEVPAPKKHWNEYDRFLEACVPVVSGRAGSADEYPEVKP